MRELRDRVRAEVGKVLVGQDEAVELMLAALVCRGHVLLEGVPGVAKTLAANAVARALGLEYRRVQFTPDMLPSDLTGTMTLKGGELVFRAGPVFTQLLLADEINRTPPKTQAALLEAMQEAQVTIEGEPHPLPDPFLVVATQNPIEYEGTYPLPEAQLDRFTMRLEVGYPPLQDEARMLAEQTNESPLDDLQPVASAAEVLAAIAAAKDIFVEEELNRYVVAVLRHTRADPRLYVGASPRSGIALLRVAKARALAEGRDFALPDDVKAVAEHVLAHRLVLAPEARSSGMSGAELVQDALARTPVPV